MPRRLDAIDIILPAEFADILYEHRLAEPSEGHRSGLAQMTLEGLGTASIFVTLTQGPLTVLQLHDAFKRWRERGHARNESIGRVTLRGHRGVIDIYLDRDSDLTKIAELAQQTLFAESATPSPRPDL